MKRKMKVKDYCIKKKDEILKNNRKKCIMKN